VEANCRRKDRGLGRARAEKYLIPGLGKKLLRKVAVTDLSSYHLPPLAVSPVAKKLFRKTEERLPDRLTDEEVGALLGIEERYAFIIRLAALATGLQWAEM
jgi:hypothetical protein